MVESLFRLPQNNVKSNHLHNVQEIKKPQIFFFFFLILLSLYKKNAPPVSQTSTLPIRTANTKEINNSTLLELYLVQWKHDPAMLHKALQQVFTIHCL